MKLTSPTKMIATALTIAAVFANGAVWVANGRDGTVSRIDPDTLNVSTTTVGGTPTGIVAAGDSVWAAVRP